MAKNKDTYLIEKAKLTHGNKYDYAKVNYINARTKVCIICPEHGEFWQLLYNHAKGQKCPKCKIREEIPLTQIQKEILCGTLLGDSSLQYTSPYARLPIFTCTHGEPQKSYAELLAQQLNGRLTVLNRYDKRTKKTYICYRITTLYNSEYELMYNQLYSTGKKRIIKDFLKNFTARSLAYLYMDDGYTVRNTMLLCTDSFDEKSCDIFINYCLETFNIKFTKNKRGNNFRLRLCFDDRQKFVDLISPYLLDEMKYKIPTNIVYKPHTNNFKVTTTIFVEKLQKIYGDIFDYTKVEYKNNHTPVCLLKNGIITTNYGELLKYF